jgi:hypothetical protein
MDLYTPPFDLKIELLLQLFDDAVADVAEGSDVIGKDLNAYGHESDLVCDSIFIPYSARWGAITAFSGVFHFARFEQYALCSYHADKRYEKEGKLSLVDVQH